MVDELGSLVDTNGQLPAGHPFLNVKTGLFQTYWTANCVPGFTSAAYILGFSGTAGSEVVTNSNFFWCIRAPGGPAF